MMKRMTELRRRHAIHALALCCTFGVACGDGLTEVDSITDLAGRWEATSVEFTVIADPQQTADIIQEGGALVLVIEDDGSVRQETTFPGDTEPEIDLGTVRLAGDSLVFDFGGETVSFAHTLSSEVLTLAGDVELEQGDFGFTSDEFEIPAQLEMSLRRI
ncbi:hypothetical protein BH24GEM1_BH24GEM1_05570 [soil metagenome]